MDYSPEIIQRAEKITLLLLDVDGVLTDGTLVYTGASVESKSFHTQDGFGLRLLTEAGIETGIITARCSDIVARRAKELQMTHICQGVPNKRTAFEKIISSCGKESEQIAYMGDDWLDLVLFSRVGLAISPANGVTEVQNAAHFVTPRQGGAGAVRDVCDLLLTAKGIREQFLHRYQG